MINNVRLILLMILATITSINVNAENIVSEAADEITKKTQNVLTDEEYYKQFQTFFEFINEHYVHVPDKQKMIDEAIRGMLRALDPYSDYFTGSDFLDITKGEFGGIGVNVLYDEESLRVISSLNGLPGHKAGIKCGDHIVAINGKSVLSLGHSGSLKEMQGKPGTNVTLLVIKESGIEPQELELTRETIKIKPIEAHLEKGNIAYVRISILNELAISELKLAMAKLKKESGNNIKGIILDLRDNIGGTLNQAVAVSEYFIDSGLIAKIEGRSSSDIKEYVIGPGLTANTRGASPSYGIDIESNPFVPKAPKVPMVALINGGSASATELVAGALRDNKRALLIGTKSFGKGHIQIPVPFPHTHHVESTLKLTMFTCRTPSGRSIQNVGIEPDIVIDPIEVRFPDDKKLSIRFSENASKNDIKRENGDDNEGKEQTKNDKSTNKNQVSKLYKEDYQFARAYDIIRALIIHNQSS